MDVWTAAVNLGLATTISLIFVLETRARDRRNLAERAKTEDWIRATLQESLTDCTQALTHSTAAQHETARALNAHAQALNQFSLLLEAGICPLTPARPKSTDAPKPATSATSRAGSPAAD